MTTTYVGKIGRLPLSIREQLDSRIEDGEPGKKLVKWLNSEPDALKVLQVQFEGRPITEQNLSEWKQTGHQDWVRHEESCSLVSQLNEQVDDLDSVADGTKISDLLAGVFEAELIGVIGARLQKENDPEKRWTIICEMLPRLSQLRRDDHRAVRAFIERDRWNRQSDREDEEDAERKKQANKKQLIEMVCAPMEDRITAQIHGGGKYGKRMAEMLHRIHFDLPLDDLLGKKSPRKTCSKRNPTKIKPKSNLIQPETAQIQQKSNLIQPNTT